MRRTIFSTAAILLALSSAAAARPRWQTVPQLPAMPAADASGEVAVDDAKIHYASFGKGPAVVLLHGGLGNGDYMVLQLGALAPAHRVIVIDARGHGRSTLGSHGLHYHQMAEDVIAVLDALAIDHAAVVGWSDGAIVGIDLAIHHGERITRVFAFGANSDPSGMIPHGGRAAAIAAYFARASADTRRLTPEPKRGDERMAALDAMWSHEPSYTADELASIKIPVAIADGDHEELIKRAHTEQLAKRIPGAQLVIFKDASHLAIWQAPDDFNRAMLAFVDDQAAK